MRKNIKAVFLVLGIFMLLCTALVACILSTAVVNRERYPVFGVDVSHYQGKINWKTLERQGVEFAFIKATEGSGHTDESVKENLKDAAQTDIKISCYHFFSFDSAGETQAENFISAVPAESINMPPVIDIEYYGDKQKNKPTPEETEKILLPLIERLEEYYGVKPIIYSTLPVYMRYVSGKYSDCPLWIRSTSFEPDLLEWKFWQYDSTSRLEGYKGKEECIDFNVYCGSREEFAEEFSY